MTVEEALKKLVNAGTYLRNSEKDYESIMCSEKNTARLKIELARDRFDECLKESRKVLKDVKDSNQMELF